MKTVVLALLLLIFFTQFANAEDKFKLTGEVENLQITETKDALKVTLKVKLSLKVIGSESVLIWRQTYPHDESLRGHFLCLNLRIFGSAATENKEKLLYLDGLPLPSIQRTKEWRDVIAEMDKETPPESQVQKINYGESIDFIGVWDVVFLKKKALTSDDPNWGSRSANNALADEIMNAKDVTLEVNYRTWSPELETSSAARESKRPFGKKLQKRWKKYGYLWFDDIASERIPLDLSLASVKRESAL